MGNQNNGRSIPGIHQFGIPVVRIEVEPGAYADALHEIDRLHTKLEESRKKTAKEIIRDYYIARETEKSLGFREYLRRIGVESRENYLRKKKSEYDKARRRGRRGNTRKSQKAFNSDK